MSENIIIETIKVCGIILSALLSAVLTWRLNKIHSQINSRMDQLLELTKSSSHAEGKKEQVETDTAVALAVAADTYTKKEKQ